MRVFVIGSGLTALALAKALVNENIPVDISISKTIKKISKNRTLGISKSNFDYFNKKIINIKKIAYKATIAIYIKCKYIRIIMR